MTVPAGSYEDIRYEVDGPAAIVTINRPERYNAFRGKTVEELIAAFRAAWADKRARAVILTGAGHDEIAPQRSRCAAVGDLP